MSASFTFLAAGLAILAQGVSAQGITVPGGSNPTAGSVVSPAGADIVPVGQPWTIKWTVKTDGCGDTVDLALLKKNPDHDWVDGYSWIAKGVANSAGQYSWTPDASLEPGTKLWGIELICTATQAYQYTERFGISNAGYNAAPSSSSASTTSAASSTSGSPSSYTKGSSSATVSSSSTSICTTLTTTKKSSTTKSVPYPVSSTGGANVTSAYPNGTSSITVTTVVPGTTTAPVTTSSTASTATPSRTGNAGDNLKASFGGLVAAAAVAVFAL